jgi:hypothetical protein
MNQRVLLVLSLALLALTGCAIVGGIFKAGVWVGILVVVLVLIGVFWILRKFQG